MAFKEVHVTHTYRSCRRCTLLIRSEDGLLYDHGLLCRPKLNNPLTPVLRHIQIIKMHFDGALNFLKHLCQESCAAKSVQLFTNQYHISNYSILYCKAPGFEVEAEGESGDQVWGNGTRYLTKSAWRNGSNAIGC